MTATNLAHLDWLLNVGALARGTPRASAVT